MGSKAIVRLKSTKIEERRAKINHNETKKKELKLVFPSMLCEFKLAKITWHTSLYKMSQNVIKKN